MIEKIVQHVGGGMAYAWTYLYARPRVWVEGNPWKAVAAAFVVGSIVGTLTRAV